MAQGYKLQHRYQDSGWEDMGEWHASPDDAVFRAVQCSANSICYGMVRVIDLCRNEVLVEFPAGCE